MSKRFASLAVLAVMLIAIAGCSTATQTSTATPSTPPRDQPSPAAMESAATAASALIGMTAPDFALPDQDGKRVALSEQRGKWVVLYFYPKNDTPGCACQATDFTDLLQAFGDMNAIILGVSPDSPADHRYFRQKYQLKLTLLSDQDTQVMKQYGAWVEAGMAGKAAGRVVRSTFIIDPQGNIVHHWPEVIPVGHAKRVRDKLESLQAQR